MNITKGKFKKLLRKGNKKQTNKIKKKVHFRRKKTNNRSLKKGGTRVNLRDKTLKKGGEKKMFNLLDKSQIPPRKKIKYCDYLIVNNKSKEILKKKVNGIIR